MKKEFIDCVAETRKEFLALVAAAPVTIYEVYDGTTDSAIERSIIGSGLQADLLRFDMRYHSKEGRSRFCSINDFQRQGYGLPAGVNQKPLPYFTSWVVQIGPVATVWSLDEVQSLILRTQEDADLIVRINHRARNESDPGE